MMFRAPTNVVRKKLIERVGTIYLYIYINILLFCHAIEFKESTAVVAPWRKLQFEVMIETSYIRQVLKLVGSFLGST